MTKDWRNRAGTTFACQKQIASGSRGMVVSNHPLASAAGAEMLAAGGNAIDAAIATLFTLTVVEPMMVGIIGGGMAHIRLADGSHRVIDGQSTVPLAVKPDTYRSKPGSAHDVFDTVGDENLVGPKSVGAPGSLKAWCETLRRFGTMSLADVMQPAIKHAARGFAVTPYLHECIGDGAAEMLKDEPISKIYLPKGAPLKVGEKVVQSDYAQTLTLIAKEGEGALYGGPLGDILVDYMEKNGGFITRKDLGWYKTVERAPIRASYRGWEILGPPPPAASGVHIAQMLNILEGHDIGAMGFGTTETVHLLAEVLKIAFADRAAASGDPDFINVPVERLTSKSYADERRAAIDPKRAQVWGAGVKQLESAHTTHMTAADAFGNVVATTQTINNLFGAKFLIPGLGVIPNNYMNLFDPRPGNALSVAAWQARHHVDVADDGPARWQDRLCARPAGRKAHLPERVPGAGQPDRSRHEPAGGGGGAAGVDRRQRARGRARGAGDRARRAHVARAHGGARRNRWRRHERHRVSRRRHHVRRRLLARRRHTGRPRGRTGEARRAVRDRAVGPPRHSGFTRRACAPG